MNSNEEMEGQMSIGEYESFHGGLSKSLAILLDEIGIKLYQKNGEIRHFDKVLYDLKEIWSDLSFEKQKEIVEITTRVMK